MTSSTINKADTNILSIDPIHFHMKQLYNAYSFFPSITYYRKMEVDVGRIDGSMSSNALMSVSTDIDNWLLGFNAVASSEEIQRQYVSDDDDGQ